MLRWLLCVGEIGFVGMFRLVEDVVGLVHVVRWLLLMIVDWLCFHIGKVFVGEGDCYRLYL